MKVALGFHDIAGILQNLSLGFRKRGDIVLTISDTHNKFYDYNYDVDPYNLSIFLASANKDSWLRHRKILLALFWRCYKPLYRKLCLHYLIRDLRGFDYFIFIWNSGFFKEKDFLKSITRSGVKVITLFVGDEIRDREEFEQLYDTTRWQLPERYYTPSGYEKLKKLRLHEQYAYKIYSVPDQSFSAVRDYYHLRIPLQVENFRCNIPQNKPPVVIHCPSDPFVKGTDVIEETMKRLESEGFKFIFKSLRNLPNSVVLEELRMADILVDEIILHGPGVLGFEAMLCGCAVLTRYYKASPKCFRPPVVNVDQYTLYDQIKRLLINPEQIKILAKQGRNYAEQNNNSADIATHLITFQEPDYVIGTD